MCQQCRHAYQRHDGVDGDGDTTADVNANAAAVATPAVAVAAAAAAACNGAYQAAQPRNEIDGEQRSKRL
jgi:hypothetical protein